MKKEEKIKRYIDGLYSRDEVSEVFRLLGDSEDETVFRRFSDEAVGRAERLAPWKDEKERERLISEASALYRRLDSSGKKTFSMRRKWLSVAACVVLVMSLAVSGVLYVNRLKPVTEAARIEVASSYGEIKTVVLPDGTQVSLNACSRLNYPENFSNASSRTVVLHGQGFFKVARNEDQPFIVKTANLDVRVLGTEFDVKSYDTDELVSVNIKSGKVQVEMPDVSMKLSADEHFHYNTSSGSLGKYHAQSEVAAWQRGELQFENTPIRDVAHELERMFHCTVAFAPDQYFDNMITGSQRCEHVESALESLKYICGIHYKKEGNGRYVLYHP